MNGSPETAAPGRMPDFFVVGHPKCGTSALYRMLRSHPQIYMPELKEPWFFVPELRSRFAHANGRPETLEQYLALFAPAAPDQRVGEASPSYLLSQGAAGRIAALAPAARIVAILREPASFLRSLHLQLVQNHVEDETDLGRALALEDERRAGRHIPSRSSRPQLLLYSEHVRYVEQLRRYEQLFGAERMLVLIYDDFRGDNVAAVRRVLRFLDVADDVPIQAREANPSVRVRSLALHQALGAVSVGQGPASRALKRSIKSVAPRRLRRAALRTVRRQVVYGAPQATDAGLVRQLRSRHRAEVVALSEYLDRDLLGLWGYDRIA